MFSKNFDKTKTEKPKNTKDRIKKVNSLGLGLLAASSMNMMDIKAVFARDQVTAAFAMARFVEMKSVGAKDTTRIPNQFLTNKDYFQQVSVRLDIDSTFNTFGKNGNLIIVVNGPDAKNLNINGVDFKKYSSTTYDKNSRNGSTLDGNPRFSFTSISRSTPDIIKNGYDGRKIFKEYFNHKSTDLASPKILSETLNDIDGTSQKIKAVNNGVLSGEGQSVIGFHIPKGGKIIPQIKKIITARVTAEDIDALLGSDVQFENSTVEFLFPKNLIVNYSKLKQLMKNMKYCDVVIQEDGMANAADEEGTTYDSFKDIVLEDNTLEYSRYVKEHNLESKAAPAKKSTGNGSEGIPYFSIFFTEDELKARFPNAKFDAIKSVKVEAKTKPADYNPDTPKVEVPSSVEEDYKINGRELSENEKVKFANTVTAFNSTNPGRLRTGDYVTIVFNKPLPPGTGYRAYSRERSASGDTKWSPITKLVGRSGVLVNLPYIGKTQSGILTEIKFIFQNIGREDRAIDQNVNLLRFNQDDAK